MPKQNQEMELEEVINIMNSVVCYTLCFAGGSYRDWINSTVMSICRSTGA